MDSMSAALKSGIATGLLFSILFFSIFVSFIPFLPSFPNLVFILGGLFVFFLVLLMTGAFLGGITACIFVKVVNRLPIRSTYIKAAVLGCVIWAVASPALQGIEFSGFSLLLLVLVASGSILFSYLFDRWTK